MKIILCDTSEIDTSINESFLEKFLTDDEKLKFGLFHRKQDRLNYMVGRFIIRSILSREEGILPCDLEFLYTTDGKPFVSGLSKKRYFNLSHSGTCVVCAVSEEGEVGIDVEKVIDGDNHTSIAGRYFTDSEYVDICSNPIIDRSLRFTKYWTLKEAFGKACGLGLQIPLDATEFSIDDINKTIAVRYMGRCVGYFGYLSLVQFIHSQNYVIAAAVVEGKLPRVQVLTITSFDTWNDITSSLEGLVILSRVSMTKTIAL